MHLPLLIWILHLIHFSKIEYFLCTKRGSEQNPNHFRYNHSFPVTGSSSVSSSCQAGCAACSALNGCLSCKPRFFFHLELNGMRQRGTCLSSCPRGHYGTRSPHISTCNRCKADCASCFSENFCTRCHPGHFLFRGKCERTCPQELTANTALRECTAHCEVGEWTRWGPCVRKQNVRAYRRGEKTQAPYSLIFFFQLLPLWVATTFICLHLALSTASSSVTPTLCMSSFTASMNLL
uniref:R-spondin 3 n=1 Tax=Amphilophus citrinellus TaxID=61819 RepID=A0A3Q0SFI2_AMPCI